VIDRREFWSKELSCVRKPVGTYCINLQPWRWRQNVSPKRYFPPNSLHAVTTRNNNIFILTALRTSSLTFSIILFSHALKLNFSLKESWPSFPPVYSIFSTMLLRIFVLRVCLYRFVMVDMCPFYTGTPHPHFSFRCGERWSQCQLRTVRFTTYSWHLFDFLSSRYRVVWSPLLYLHVFTLSLQAVLFRMLLCTTFMRRRSLPVLSSSQCYMRTVWNQVVAVCTTCCNNHQLEFCIIVLCDSFSTPASYSECPGFKSQLGNRISWLRFIVIFKNPSKWVPG
jgi:hypothetical protein